MSDFASSPVPFIAERNRDPVQIPKAAQIVASRIRRQIVDSELKSNERLAPEAELAVSFGVSRPVVREALRILETEGFIELGRGARKGAKVGESAPDIIVRAMGIALRINGATLGDIFDVRAQLEPAAARFAALHRPKEASAALRSHVAYQLTVIDDQSKFVRSYGEWHRILLEECGNTTLSVTGLALKKVVETHLDLIREQMPRPTHTHKAKLWCVHSHQRLADLIAGRSDAEAEAHWRDHMNAISKFWVRGESQLSVLQIRD